jgi:hypothetical protein
MGGRRTRMRRRRRRLSERTDAAGSLGSEERVVWHAGVVSVSCQGGRIFSEGGSKVYQYIFIEYGSGRASSHST